jgi:hypothetical protein
LEHTKVPIELLESCRGNKDKNIIYNLESVLLYAHVLRDAHIASATGARCFGKFGDFKLLHHPPHISNTPKHHPITTCGDFLITSTVNGEASTTVFF